MMIISLNKFLFEGMDDKLEKIRFLLVMLFVFSLPFNIFYSSLTLITLIVTTSIDFRLEKLKLIPKQIWIFQLIFLLSVIGYFYSLHRHSAGFLMERQLNILLLPVLLPLAIRLDQKRINALLATLSVSVMLALCWLFAYMIYSITCDLHLPLVKAVLSGTFFNHQFSRPLGIHAGYLSMYVSLSIFYLVQLFITSVSPKIRTLLILALVLLFTGLFFLAARNTVIATFLILILVFPLYNIQNKLRYIGIVLLCLVAGFIFINNVPYLKDRFSIELISDIRPLGKGQLINYSKVEPRFERWKGAMSLIEKSPLIGYGTGDEIEMLKTEYMKRGLFISYLEDFNAHNQYLSYLVKNGIAGFCIFLFAFFYYFRLAVKSKDFLYLSFLLLLLIGFYTENILDANKGILFFALFNTCFGYVALKKKSNKARPE